MKELYALSSYALNDLLEIWDYIRVDNPEAADRVEADCSRNVNRLLERQGKGTGDPTTPKLRFCSSRFTHT
jgi:plasmid stabilization system protein ParE